VAENGHGMIETSELTASEQADELLLMGLRLREGINLKRWGALAGRDLDPDRTDFLIHHGMIEQMDTDRIRCTPAGMLVLDAVVADLAF
jgi:coproporphyrinogen III oxidase-like Fe-S oxidoreductase